MNRTREQIIRVLLTGPASFWRLIREQDGDLPLFVQTLEELYKQGIIFCEGGRLSLTAKGRELAASHGIKPWQQVLCPHCHGKTVMAGGLFSQVAEEFQQLVSDRPMAIAEYDQGYVDPLSTVARVVVMYQRGDLENKDIFLIGDDDLTSIAIALTGMARSVTVLEVDNRLVDYINDMAVRRGWDSFLRALCYDVRENLPEEHQRRYDTFLIDPVETLPGFTLFFTRSVQALRGKGGAGYFGLTHLEASRNKWHALQKMILNMNFVITDIIHNFQEYELEREGFVAKDYPLVSKVSFPLPVPELNWYTSNFYRVEAVADPAIVAGTNIPVGRELYFDQESYATLP